MSDTIQPLPVPTFLDEDLSKVDTSMPVLKGNVSLEFEIVEVVTEQSKDQTGTNLLIKFKTTKPEASNRLDPETRSTVMIPAGQPCSKRIGMNPVTGRPGKRDYTDDDIRRGLAQFLESVEGKATKIFPLDRFKGKRFIAKVGIQPGNEQFPNESNSFTFMKAPKV